VFLKGNSVRYLQGYLGTLINRPDQLMGVPQAHKTFHIHGYLERHFRAIHRGISARVFVLPIFRSTDFSSHLVAVLIAKKRSLTGTRLQSVVAHTHPLPS